LEPRQDRGALALVEPDGREWTRGELRAACNRIVHGLSALGLGKGDVVAAVLQNDAAIIE
jgi:long-chain acyl-CoA synthetase